MWGILKTDHYARRYRKYGKKKQKELHAVENNLDIFLKSLRSGEKPKPLLFGFLHSEPMGVIAVDQTGGQKLSETRLYVYPDVGTNTLYLLTLGDKSTQHDDIQDCKRFVKQITTDPGLRRRVDDGDYEQDHVDNQEREQY